MRRRVQIEIEGGDTFCSSKCRGLWTAGPCEYRCLLFAEELGRGTGASGLRRCQACLDAEIKFDPDALPEIYVPPQCEGWEVQPRLRKEAGERFVYAREVAEGRRGAGFGGRNELTDREAIEAWNKLWRQK